eukprot:FR734522.1.p1 GENE.FR734522.1~~FR734522.1.p1  ORF type:complete len:214 (+),score=16.18 FR734522.1:79-642(+)
MMHASDWFPTLAEVTARDGSLDDVVLEVDGVSMWGAFHSDMSPRSEIIVNIDPLDGWSGAIISTGNSDAGDTSSLFKVIFMGTEEHAAGVGVGWLHCGSMQVEPAPSNEGCTKRTLLLFDLSNDPNERTDLSNNTVYSSVLKHLVAKWRVAAKSAVMPNYPGTDPNSYPELREGEYYGTWAPWALGH